MSGFDEGAVPQPGDDATAPPLSENGESLSHADPGILVSPQIEQGAPNLKGSVHRIETSRPVVLDEQGERTQGQG